MPLKELCTDGECHLISFIPHLKGVRSQLIVLLWYQSRKICMQDVYLETKISNTYESFTMN